MCGVTTAGLARFASSTCHSACAASRFSPSASITSGPNQASKTVPSSTPACSSTPSPGPIPMTSAHSIAQVSFSFASSALRYAVTIASGSLVWSTTRLHSGVSTRTSPLPIRYAASAQKQAAPLIPSAPAISSTFPHVPLFDHGSRPGSRHKSSVPGRNAAASSFRTGIPTKRQTTFPQKSAAGYSTWPSFRAANVTVRSARTATEETLPVSERMPDGISTAILYAAEALSFSISSAYTPFTSRDRPIPNNASTIVVYSFSGKFLTIFILQFSQIVF